MVFSRAFCLIILSGRTKKLQISTSNLRDQPGEEVDKKWSLEYSVKFPEYNQRAYPPRAFASQRISCGFKFLSDLLPAVELASASDCIVLSAWR